MSDIGDPITEIRLQLNASNFELITLSIQHSAFTLRAGGLL